MTVPTTTTHSDLTTHVGIHLFIISFGCLAPLLILADTSLFETTKVSIVIAVQVCGGATMWRLFRTRQVSSLPELLAMGLALGSFVSLLSFLALRSTALREIAWCVPWILIAILGWIPKIRVRIGASEIEKTSPFTIFIIAIATLVSLTYWWWWLWPMIPAITVVRFVVFSRRFTKVLNVIATLLLLTPLIALTVWFRKFNLDWWVFSNDQVFSESLSHSLVIFGPKENIQFVGEPLSYHWFSLAWAGMTTKAGAIGPWVVVTKVLPICSLFGAICLTWACTRELTRSRLTPTLSLLVLVLCSNPFSANPFRVFHSPTFFFSMVWLLGFTFIFILGINSRIKGAGFLLGLMLAASLGGKVSSGAVAFCGFMLCAVASIALVRNRNSTRFILKGFIWSIVACLVIYFAVYSSETIGSDSILGWGFGKIGSHVGLATWGARTIFRVSGWIGAIAGITPAGSIIFVLFLLPSTRRRIEPFYFLGALLSSLIFISIFSNGGASQLYFYYSAMVVAPIGIGWSLDEQLGQFRSMVSNKQVLAALGAGFLVSILTWLLWDWTPPGFDSQKTVIALRMSLLLALWISAFVIPFFLVPLKGGTKQGHPILLIRVFFASLILIAGSISFGTLERFDVLRNISTRSAMSQSDPNLITGSIGHREALAWLQKNSKKEDIVATNRFCIPNQSQCSSRWFLVSALSQRRMLIEGGYWGGDPPINVRDRVNFSRDFGEKPTYLGLVWLREHDVSWVFIDYAAQSSGLRSWEPFGTTMFSNDVASIVQLSQQLQP
jgi:hypothetical protein